MKVIRRMLIIFIICLLFEVGLLVREGCTYTKYKYSNLTPNGRIICQLDNWFNFSGMAK